MWYTNTIIYFFMQNIQHTQSTKQQERYKKYLKKTVLVPYALKQLQEEGWNFKGIGHWEFTGEVLNFRDHIAISNCIKHLTAPNATEVVVDNCPFLEKIYAPNATFVLADDCCALTQIDAINATTVNARNCRALEEIYVPNATTVIARNCRALEEIYAPNATTVLANNCRALKQIDAPKATAVCVDNNALRDVIISQLQNPQNIVRFTANYSDITQDIKNADMELTNEYEEEYVQPYLQDAMTKFNQQPYMQKVIDEQYHKDNELGIALGCYNFADDKSQRKVLIHNLKSNPETKRQFNFDSSAIEESFKNFKKDNILQKTRENAQARGVSL